MSTPSKRSVGRPRRTPQPDPMPRNGIVYEPSSSDNLVEMSYDNVSVFKKIFNLISSPRAEGTLGNLFLILFRFNSSEPLFNLNPPQPLL